jgi:V/A-type H+-transporting ATPase subunit C
MSSDYGYINARIKAMRSRLLDPGTFGELLASRDFAAFWQVLGSSPYGKELEEESSRGGLTLQSLETALRRRLVATVRKLLAISAGRPRELVEISLRRWDLLNLKTIVRAKRAGGTQSEVEENLLPAGTLTETRLKELWRQDSVESIALTLATWQDPFSAPLREHASEEDLTLLDLSLDRFHFADALARCRGRDYNSRRVRGMLQSELDAVNALTALRLTGSESTKRDPMTFFIEGGTDVSLALFEKIVHSRSLAAGWQEVAGAFGERFEAPQSASEAQDRLERLLSRRVARWYGGNPLSIDVALGYIWLLYGEIINLRLIARAKSLAIPPDRLQKELTLA